MVSPLEVVQAQVDAYNAHDAEALTACFQSDAVVVGPDGNVMMSGGEAINGMYAQLFGQSPDLHVDIVSRMCVGNWVVDEEETSGLVFEGFPRDLHAVVIYQVSDGLIVRAQILA
jgi:putative hydrolase of HD superfamily